MNSSSEPFLALTYSPMQYREADEPLPTEDEDARQASGGSHDSTSAVAVVAPVPNVEELFAARLEAEHQVITAQVRQESEDKIERARSEITRALYQFAQQRDEYFQKVEGEVVGLALAIARRLLHRESQIDPRLLSGLVNFELEQLETATRVRLVVPPDNTNYWKECAQTLSRPVEILPDKSLAPDEVRIEAALGSTTLGFERELKELERGFFDLLSHRPVAADTPQVRVQ